MEYMLCSILYSSKHISHTNNVIRNTLLHHSILRWSSQARMGPATNTASNIYHWWSTFKEMTSSEIFVLVYYHHRFLRLNHSAIFALRYSIFTQSWYIQTKLVAIYILSTKSRNISKPRNASMSSRIHDPGENMKQQGSYIQRNKHEQI